ncbi:MAG: hypothetical protein MMC23_003440 [Stictis urceolatum]|nr:hypothetical protein [Stictis urceolata]
MLPPRSLLASFACIFFAPFNIQLVAAQSATSAEATPIPGATSASTAPSTPPTSVVSATGTSSSGGNNSSSLSGPPDVVLNVPNLSVGRIELDVEQLSADINLNAKVAGLVTINAGVQLSVEKVNITIVDVEAELELVVRLGHLVDIVNRVFESLDLNPLLIGVLNNVTSLVGDVVGAVDGLLGSVTQNGNVLNFLVDNLGNIVQEVTAAGGGAVSSIVGNFNDNMTFTGVTQTLDNGLVQKQYSYSPLNALVNIIFTAGGQVVQATVQKKDGSTTTTSSSPASTGTAGAARLRY